MSNPLVAIAPKFGPLSLQLSKHYLAASVTNASFVGYLPDGPKVSVSGGGGVMPLGPSFGPAVSDNSILQLQPQVNLTNTHNRSGTLTFKIPGPATGVPTVTVQNKAQAVTIKQATANTAPLSLRKSTKYSYTWNTANTTHDVDTTVTASTNTQGSLPVSYRIYGGTNSASTVTWVTASQNVYINDTQPIIFTLADVDKDPITYYLYDNLGLIKTDTVSSNQTISVPYTNATIGTHSFSLKLIDDAQAETDSTGPTLNVFPQADAPTASEPSGTYLGSATVTLASDQSGSIYYTLDGTTPTSASALYSTAIVITTSCTLNAVSIVPNYKVSPVLTVTYNIKTSTPVIQTASGTYTSAQSVSITCDTNNSTIIYTEDGTDPAINTNPQIAATTTSQLWRTGCVSSNDILYAAVYGGYIYKSLNRGLNWIQLSAPQLNWSTSCIGADGSLYFGAYGNYIYKSTDNGTTWAPVVSEGTRSWNTSCAGTDGSLYFGIDNGYLHVSNDNGNTWTSKTSLGMKTWATCCVASNGTIYFAASNESVYASLDKGTTWTPNAILGTQQWTTSCVGLDHALYLGASNGSIYKSTDQGTSWAALSAAGTANWVASTVGTDGSLYFAASGTANIKKSTDAGATWTDIVIASQGTWDFLLTGTDGSIYASDASTEAGGYIYKIPAGTWEVANGYIYSAPVTVTRTETLKAISTVSGQVASDVASTSYQLKASIPTFDPIAGNYTRYITVTLASSLSGSTTYYTLDGTDPTTESPVYNTGIRLTQPTTIKALTAYATWENSDIATAVYNVTTPQVPTFSVPAGTYNTAQTVALACSTTGASIYYTLDGTDPSPDATESPTSILYTTSIAVDVSKTIKALATTEGDARSDIVTATYELKAVSPVFSAATGTFTDNFVTSIATTTSNAKIYYTIDGTTPTIDSYLYSSPLDIFSTITLKAIAIFAGWTSSDVTTVTYTFIPKTSVAPTFSLPTGTYTEAIAVSLASPTPNKIIRYTLDGTDPSVTSSIYLGVLTISQTTTIKAYVTSPGYNDSTIAIVTYTINIPVPVPEGHVVPVYSNLYVYDFKMGLREVCAFLTAST